MENKGKRISHYMLFALAIWFCANLLSQSAFMAIYGIPYDAITLLKSLGPIYYAIMLAELLLWVFAGGWLIKWFTAKLSANPKPHDIIEGKNSVKKSSLILKINRFV